MEEGIWPVLEGAREQSGKHQHQRLSHRCKHPVLLSCTSDQKVSVEKGHGPLWHAWTRKSGKMGRKVMRRIRLTVAGSLVGDSEDGNGGIVFPATTAA